MTARLNYFGPLQEVRKKTGTHYRKPRPGLGIRQPKNKIKRRHILKKQFGLTEHDYDQLLKIQSGVCAICKLPETGVSGPKRTPRVLAVDHSHTTGKVRGLLCHFCNSALGLFHDNVELLATAITYLERSAKSE